MTKSAVRDPLSIKRGLLLTLTCLAVCLSSGASQASANNYNFCQTGGVTLAPYGHTGDRCWAWGGGYLFSVELGTYERSGCIDVTDGPPENSHLLQSWTCFPAGSNPAGYLFFNNDGQYRKAVMRNNNLSYSATFTGNYVCYNEC